MIILASLIGWGLVIGIPLYGLRRGSGTMLCVGSCLMLAGLAASELGSGLGQTLPLGAEAGSPANGARYSLLLFLPCLAAAFPLGLFLHRFIVTSFDPFDWLIGFILGCITAFFVVRMLYACLPPVYEDTAFAPEINRLFLMRHLVRLEGWHGFANWIGSLVEPRYLTMPEE